MQKNQAVVPFVEFLMSKEKSVQWRIQLCNQQIFTSEEMEQLTDDQVSLIQRALLVQRYLNFTETQLMQEIERHQFQYRFDMNEEDYRAGAVCY